ncbi:unnamed protein product [Darwinula stevensoni]|uniref:Uncharacterized protein n=1 Tax=Darwinula stevensoni TaxID=69355 RepID=A0A7R8XAB4_9CRUS|nr:unnamed protein product [Darwinula stevensoni]CAG0891766.1 unnamed protein product [Darwinula stevensoni]
MRRVDLSSVEWVLVLPMNQLYKTEVYGRAERVEKGGRGREENIQTNEQLRFVRAKVEESYETARHALINLQNKYAESKNVKNVFHRYSLLKAMIKEVVRLDAQYWALMDIPRQEKQEAVSAYVLRACATLQTLTKAGEGFKTSAKVAEEEERRRELQARLDVMTTGEIDNENSQLINDLYRLLKKYSSLRLVIRGLKEEYFDSRFYPIFPRYILLKDMIKDVIHAPAFMEVCHEVES